jgi:cation:H+ antiporter
MLILGIALVAAGIAVLWRAADPFVVAAARLAHLWGMSPILIGALIIGFGTSAPELLVSTIAAVRENLPAAVGNVVGSNAANLSLVLGVSALISPVFGHSKTMRREGVVTVLAMATVLWTMWDDRLDRLEGSWLLGGMLVASLLLVMWSRRDVAEVGVVLDIEGVEDGETYRVGRELLVALVSIVAIVVGAALLNEGGEIVAEELSLTGGFVGATIFALGTSLPELVTAIAAARRRPNDLVVGNVLGSNIFNSLLVVGTAASVGPGILSERRLNELLVMMGIGLFAALLTISRNRLSRFEGLSLLAAYGLFLAATAQQATV